MHATDNTQGSVKLGNALCSCIQTRVSEKFGSCVRNSYICVNPGFRLQAVGKSKGE